MDRNTMIGLGLIGAILATFTFMYKPSEADIKKEKAAIEATKAAEKEIAKSKTKVISNKNATDDVSSKAGDSTKTVAGGIQTVQSGEIIRLETDKVIYDFSTKGGVLASVYLKEFQTYHNFAKNKKEVKPLKLFGENDAVNELAFQLDGKNFKTGDKLFTVASKSNKGITFELTPEEGQKIQFVYSLKKDAYDLDFEVKMKGFGDHVTAQNVLLNWNVDFLKSERLLTEQRRVSTICYKYKNEDVNYLSEMGDDELKLENSLDWLIYKQSYFSSAMNPVQGFGKSGSEIEVKNFTEGQEKYHTHIKKYTASLNLDFTNVDDASARINWFFGPNDYETLKTYNSDYEDIINFGWGVFRWINIYAIQPLFNLLASTGLGFGLVILLLTIILKVVLTPIQWKMYVSSAKMKILKPEIDELNAKFPKKEDAMKKQTEMMALYRESGASPLSGCVPMLIQMPILLAVFRFFPASFELRQQSFLWASDLSSYDSIYDFGTYIPLYGDHISLFTLLMAVTTLIYTHLNSGNMQQQQQPGMPNMKIIMYIFPFMMIFFFNNYSSGLSYYYFISTLMSILIMLAIKQFFVDEEKLKAKMALRKAEKSAKNGGERKKSKFQERLEQMQKAQQEKLKGKK